MTMSRQQKLYKLPAKPHLPGLRQMQPKDVEQVHALLTKHLAQFKLYVQFEPEDVAHWVLPRPNVVDSYVVVARDGTITDFCSYYYLPSSILKHPRHKKLNAMYSYYNVATSVPLEVLMKDCLIMVRTRH